jgi:hypothetical protein
VTDRASVDFYQTPRFDGWLVSSDMDPFDRTFLPAAAEAGLPMASITRQIPIFRRCVGLGQTVLLVTRCTRLDRLFSADHLMLLTRERLVITSESRLLRRVRLHLDVDVNELRNVAWEADGRLASIELSATAASAGRQRFRIKARRPGNVWHLDAVLGYVFRPSGTRRFQSVSSVAPTPWMNPVGAY